ncbi:FAD/NAD(P)-binding protein [Candidatus Formimonas warabiya]|uniref:Heterodisulfide reductase subunit F n=1 Tax=Formimonas warabiya TaxID=1761012 RepID=A0A3G1KZ75_FORW1|nr:FAD/NAD(P)-binding protein [Candidatus Formimonas warabiya]ATW27515.1 heterodisulfide reductase subunit F [Candidatus Formimonas warabiya]
MKTNHERENPYLPYPLEILAVKEENPEKDLKTFYLKFLHPEQESSFRYLPGQFGELGVFGTGEAPFGLASSPTEKGILSFTVKKVGSVTSALHMLEKGDVVGLRGPLGNHWPLPYFSGKNLVVIGGGFAFTTLRSLVYYYLDPENRKKIGDLTVIYGARDPDQFLYKEELKKWLERSDLHLHLTIDQPAEGWSGQIGFIPAVAEQVLSSSSHAVAVVCGPPVMIRFTFPVLEKIGFSPENIFTSLEMKMKCGIGMCGRCNIGPKYVCKDGPVFSLAELNQLPDDY